MQDLYQSCQIREIEQLAISQGMSEYQLMNNAGQAAWDVLQQHWPNAQRIVVFCGKGNNAGDGYVLARLAHAAGLRVTVISPGGNVPLSDAAREACVASQTQGVPEQPFSTALTLSADVIVDALLGTGLRGEVAEPLASMIEQINSLDIPVLALDVPSGLDADNGCISNVAVRADVTVTFIALKTGLFTRSGPAYAGEICLDTLSLSKKILQCVEPTADLLTWESIKPLLKKRPMDSHKGDYGHVLVIGGDYGMGGAVRMAAEAALRVGSGLVTVATRPEHVPIVSGSRPELMCHQIAEAADLDPLLTSATVIVLGPGLGKSPWAEALLTRVLASSLPKILDADALNLLSLNATRRDDWILTPHPGEAGRLLGEACQDLQQDRFAAVRKLQAQYGGVIVLKGAGTLIHVAGGRTHVCPAGNPGMASGGMGDVLSGVIGGLLAQGLSLAAAAQAGVLIHAKAGDRAATEGGERGLLATDVLAQLRYFVNPRGATRSR